MVEIRSLEFALDRIKFILKMPDAWGQPHAVELQILLLIELAHVAKDNKKEVIDGVMERYGCYLGIAIPGFNTDLANRLGLTSRANQEFINLLTTFIDVERRLGKWDE